MATVMNVAATAGRDSRWNISALISTLPYVASASVYLVPFDFQPIHLDAQPRCRLKVSHLQLDRSLASRRSICFYRLNLEVLNGCCLVEFDGFCCCLGFCVLNLSLRYLSLQ